MHSFNWNISRSQENVVELVKNTPDNFITLFTRVAIRLSTSLDIQQGQLTKLIEEFLVYANKQIMKTGRSCRY